MVFLAAPGPITATVLLAPEGNAGFSTYYIFSIGAGGGQYALGIFTGDSVGKTVTTIPIPDQGGGVPVIFQAYLSGPGALGAMITTGWVEANNFRCCGDFLKAPAKVTFGANNTAVVSFASDLSGVPLSWVQRPLQIQLTNVTSNCVLK